MVTTYGVGGTGTCPHCGKDVQFIAAPVVAALPEGEIREVRRLRYHVGPETSKQIGPNQTKRIPADDILLQVCVCPRPDCQGLVIAAVYLKRNHEKNAWEENEYLVYPRRANRKPLPVGVPKEIAADYEEACLVLSVSAQASAALSRRCLQALLHKQGFHQNGLVEQIAAARPSLPSDTSSALDQVRVIGNFAAHPMKSKNTGEIIQVEPVEADLNLEVLEALFEHYYERPARLTAKKAALNQKLIEAGKQPLP